MIYDDVFSFMFNLISRINIFSAIIRSPHTKGLRARSCVSIDRFSFHAYREGLSRALCARGRDSCAWNALNEINHAAAPIRAQGRGEDLSPSHAD